MIPNTISVGILLSNAIQFSFQGAYTFQGKTYHGNCSISLCNHHLVFNGSDYLELLFTPCDEEANSFELKDVVIGIGFHWEKKENQRFKGSLKFIVENDKIRAINILRVEDYLVSVISSEMSATSSMELLKAHAVISRSWLLKPFSSDTHFRPTAPYIHHASEVYTKWYERDAHTFFNICADDHCQRYQGITKVSTPNALAAVQATSGEVLMNNGEICDARFYKSCGGATEAFEHCWNDAHYDYLTTVADNSDESLPFDLSTEDGARKWIEYSPAAFCNTNNADVLKQVLNDFDQSTHDFYRWQVQYTQEELSLLVHQRSGIDFGIITALIPMQRGGSGRIEYLKIVGAKKTLVVGKELEIRKWLSTSHLYSSAFVVDKVNNRFILKGAGWGHGVGLCQIGAAMMSEQGYQYREILAHYYKNSSVVKVY